MYDYFAYPVAAMDTPSLPIAPEGGLPVDPGTGNGNGSNIPSTPIAPPGGLPVEPGPGPSLPNRPGLPGIIIPIPPTTGYAEVRFLHAAINAVPVSISIGSRNLATNLRYAESTNYSRVADGFRTVTVMSARSPRSVLLRKNIPFRAGERMTLAIINTATGIDLLTVPDNMCASRPQGFACFRMVNLSFNSVPLDLILYDGRVVFADVRFKEITTYRRARPGEYGFYVAVTPATPYTMLSSNVDIETMEDLPQTVADNYIPGYGDLEPIVSFTESFRAGVNYTAYVIGVGGNVSYPTTVITLEN